MSYIDNLIKLVQEYGLREREDGGSTREPRSREAEMLFANVSRGIAALVAQQPVQARDESDLPLWQHDRCGYVVHAEWAPDEPGVCPADGGNAPWRPLLVGGDPTPECDPLRCPTCDSPQPSMHPAVGGGGEITGLCPDAFHGTPQQPDLIAQVMAELIVDRPSGVLPTLASMQDRMNERDALTIKIRDERDETRAEVARLLETNRLKQKRIEELQAARPCPTCSGPTRETVGMVCQTCGIDYL